MQQVKPATELWLTVLCWNTTPGDFDRWWKARCEIRWDGDVLMDGNMTQFIILMGEAATLQALGKKGYLT